MRAYQSIILEAELAASSPESVDSKLRKKAAQSEQEWRNDPLDEAIEHALRKRGHPLIELSLARYGRYIRAIAPLFVGSPPDSALRLAILANRNVGKALLASLPADLFSSEENMQRWLLSAPDTELAALFHNPSINNGFLSDLLEGEKGWARIPEDRLLKIVSHLFHNERMTVEYEEGDDEQDGYGAYLHNRVFDAAWGLAERAPTTLAWARALQWLYDRAKPISSSMKDPIAVAERWHPTPEDEASMSRDYSGVSPGHLSSFEHVRYGLARLAFAKQTASLAQLLTHEDRAARAAACSDGALTVTQLEAAYAKDGELAFNQAVSNHSLWRTAEGRDALRTIAWDADERGAEMAINLYRLTTDSMMANKPQWFKEEEPFSYRNDELPATKADLAAITSQLDRLEASSDLFRVNKSLGWLTIISAATLLAVIVNSF